VYRGVDGACVKTEVRLTGVRILVVDDNEDATELFAEFLRDEGHEVDVALDGIEALATATRARPDVAIVDIGLPGIDGYELARQLRHACPPELRLIALTGYSQDADRERSRAAGFDLHLVKPIDCDGLKRAIER
jgi:CheY-like chemotaxis protein